MFRPVKIVHIDLQHPVGDLVGLEGYSSLQALIFLYGIPVGTVRLPVSGDRCAGNFLVRQAIKKFSKPIVRILLRESLHKPVPPGGFSLAAVLERPLLKSHTRLPHVTVAVCTRDRSEGLARCLESLTHLTYPSIEWLVIDNAPRTSETELLVRDRFPGVRYVKEERPGLDWARNRAIREAQGDLIAFTDDDVVVTPSWIDRIVWVFEENSGVMAVTGLVVPYELETVSQAMFEDYGGFGRGFGRRWYHLSQENGRQGVDHIGAGKFGTGANMAFRRRLFQEIGDFDPALDVGTVTNGGGDLEMFFRVLEEGHMLVYEPAAVVRHVHRRTASELNRQINDWGIGFYSYLFRCFHHYPRVRGSVYWFAVSYLWKRYGKAILLRLRKRTTKNIRLLLREFVGIFKSPFRYKAALRQAEHIRQAFGPQLPELHAVGKGNIRANVQKVAVRMIDLSEPLRPIDDVADYVKVRIILVWKGRSLGFVNVVNVWQPIGLDRLREAIVDALGLRLMDLQGRNTLDELEDEVLETLKQQCTVGEQVRIPLGEAGQSMFSGLVSIVLPTFDRPEKLRHCLQSLRDHRSPSPLEIIVVDNHPASRLTPPVVKDFPEVLLVEESSQGLSHARNTGILASSGEIIVTIDDDVVVPPGWLDILLAPFARQEVMAVTGNVYPRELETWSQQVFEMYGGLGRGNRSWEADRAWFDSFARRAVPTWLLGAGANAAFRATVFSHPGMGLFDERLGAGTPTGCSEDTYLFYRILQAGGVIVYEPASFVWHSHRSDLISLRHQLFNYSKGHVAYHLWTYFNDGDFRAWRRLFWELPLSYVQRLKVRLRGRSLYPVSLMLMEIAGNILGPWALWQAHRQVSRQGRSPAYTGPKQSRVSCVPNDPKGALQNSVSLNPSRPLADMPEKETC